MLCGPNPTGPIQTANDCKPFDPELFHVNVFRRCKLVHRASSPQPEMTWLTKLLADKRNAEIGVMVVQALAILSWLGLLLSLIAGLAFGPDVPPNLF